MSGLRHSPRPPSTSAIPELLYGRDIASQARDRALICIDDVAALKKTHKIKTCLERNRSAFIVMI